MGIIEDANRIPLETLRSDYLFPGRTFTNFVHPHNELEYAITLETSASISPTDMKACFRLVQETSAEYYRSSSGKWTPSNKKNEMRLPDLRYLLVKRVSPIETNVTHQEHFESIGKPTTCDDVIKVQENGRDKSPVEAFLSFMFTYEDGCEVVYCYEIHLSASLRGCGLGSRLMSLMETAGRSIGVEKTMLTVFLANQEALRFYSKCR